MSEYRLTRPSNESEWNTYHAIRREVLWEARGLKGVYNPDHPDERLPSNHPLLFFVDEKAVGVVRVDLRKESGEAIFRRVAIRTEDQRRGYGTVLMERAEAFAIEHGCVKFIANVALDAIQFYTKLGYRLDLESSEQDAHHRRMVKE